MAALRAWPEPTSAPDDVLMMRATLQQYLHEFDTSVVNLRLLLARPGSGRNAQAWLTLATVLRVQGRYADSDAACHEVAGRCDALLRSACLAENAALRGEIGAARKSFEAMLAEPRLPAATRGWLTTSLAELEERDGRVAAADIAYRAVLRLGPDSYAAIAYADFLIAQHRPAEALAVLKDETRTDTVVLRLAIAGTIAKTRAGRARRRPRCASGSRSPTSARRRASSTAASRRCSRSSSSVRRSAPSALARGDVARQREPLDLLVFAEAARASGQRDAIEEARRLKAAVGLHDRRIDALL